MARFRYVPLRRRRRKQSFAPLLVSKDQTVNLGTAFMTFAAIAVTVTPGPVSLAAAPAFTTFAAIGA